MIRAFTLGLILWIVAISYLMTIWIIKPYATLPTISHHPACPPIYYTYMILDSGVIQIAFCAEDAR